MLTESIVAMIITVLVATKFVSIASNNYFYSKNSFLTWQQQYLHNIQNISNNSDKN